MIRRLGAGAGLVLVLLVGTAAPAVAHLAIRLDIHAPQEGARVGRRVDLVIFAQPTLAGVDHTTFTVALDARPLDPTTGRTTAVPVPAIIAVSTTRTVVLDHLTPGKHQATVTYRPDVDEPLTRTSVDFVTTSPGTPNDRWLALLVLVAAAVGGVVAGRTRSGRRRPGDRRGGIGPVSPPPDTAPD